MRSAVAILLICTGTIVGHASEALPTRGDAFVTVRVHDYAHVDQRVLMEAQRLVAGFYAGVGVRAEWLAARRLDATPADPVDDRLEDLTVIVLDRRMAARRGLSADVVGSAAVGLGEVGRIAYVLYERVENVAVASDWPTTDLLAVVIAHELGHLLLPPGSHSAAGLMRGNWSVADLRRTDGRRLTFTPGQGVLMRERDAARPPR